MKRGLQQFRLIFTVCILAGLMLIPACSTNNESTSVKIKNKTTTDYWPTITWKTKDPDPQIVDIKQLKTVENAISHSLVKSMLVVHNGYIISEFYKDGDINKRFPLNSVTKSITSILMGIALDEGNIKGIDEQVKSFFPEYSDAFDSDLKKSITLEHVLSMTSGLDWPEWTDWNFSIGPLWEAEDWNGFVVKRPMAFEPGKVWNYNTGGSQLLAAIIKKATGYSEYDYGMTKLFRPLGIKDVDWIPSKDGSNAGGFGLDMTSRDLAKVGLLYLNGGYWVNRQIVSKKWVLESTSTHSNGDYHFGKYGYHWWIHSFNDKEAYFGMGYGGQYLAVVPELGLIMVFFSQADDAMDTVIPLKYMEDIVTAFKR